MYDGSAGFDLPDAIRLGRALSEADYLWYEEPMREFSVAAYRGWRRPWTYRCWSPRPPTART